MKLFLGKNKNWFVQFTGEGKTQHELDTGTPDREEAEQIVRDSKVGELEHAAKVMRLGAEAITRIVSGRRISLSEALKEWEKWMRETGHLSPHTVAANLRTVGAWLRDTDLGDMAPASVRPKHINEWINRESTHKRNTRIAWLSILRNFLLFVRANGWLVGEPAQLVRINLNALDHDQKETIHARPFSKGEIELLLGSTWNSFWYAAILLGAETGLRLGDIARLEWASFGEDKITVHTDKTNVRVVVGLSQRVKTLIGKLTRERTHPVYVFPEERELSLDPNRRHLFSQQFSRLCAKLGLGKTRRFHGLRGTFARARTEEAGIDTAARELGHSSTDTTKEFYL